MRYLPTPFHTKFAQQRSPLSQYIQQEAVGTRMRRWDRPLHDFLLPYLRGAIGRVTGAEVIPDEVQHRRDLDTLTDMLSWMRDFRGLFPDRRRHPAAQTGKCATAQFRGPSCALSCAPGCAFGEGLKERERESREPGERASGITYAL